MRTFMRSTINFLARVCFPAKLGKEDYVQWERRFRITLSNVTLFIVYVVQFRHNLRCLPLKSAGGRAMNQRFSPVPAAEAIWLHDTVDEMLSPESGVFFSNCNHRSDLRLVDLSEFIFVLSGWQCTACAVCKLRVGCRLFASHWDSSRYCLRYELYLSIYERNIKMSQIPTKPMFYQNWCSSCLLNCSANLRC